MRLLVLVDGLHSKEVFAALSRLVGLDGADVLIAYVTAPAPRSGLDLVMRRPGGRPLPPHREQELREAEVRAAGDATSDAERIARAYSTSVEAIHVTGEPGPAVCDLAERRIADLVVVRAGGRDRPAIGPGSLGPTAKFITDHCTRPVLLLRTDALS